MMNLSRRKALFGGLAGLIAAPAIIRTPGLLMPVKAIKPDLWNVRIFRGMTFVDQIVLARDGDVFDRCHFLRSSLKHSGVGGITLTNSIFEELPTTALWLVFSERQAAKIVPLVIA